MRNQEIVEIIKNNPSQIGQLKNLTALDLWGNQLSRLPAQIGELKNLTKLDLSSNKLSSLPSQIGGTQNLTKLDLIYNGLSSLPAEIGKLKNLTELFLSRNQLSSLPAEIGELQNLTKFYCDPQNIKPDNKVSFLSRGEEPRIFLKLNNNKIVCGCFSGSISEFNKQVIEKYGSMNNYCPEFVQYL